MDPSTEATSIVAPPWRRAPASTSAVDKIRWMPGRNVYTVLTETAKSSGDAIALHQPTGKKEGPAYRQYTWNEWAKISSEIGLGLRALGLVKGDIVCILSETRAEFYLVDLGIMAAGGVAAALYTAYPMADLVRNIQGARIRAFCLLKMPRLWRAFRSAAQAQGVALPEHVILMTETAPGHQSLESLAEMGRDLLARDPGALARIQDEISPQPIARFFI